MKKRKSGRVRSGNPAKQHARALPPMALVQSPRSAIFGQASIRPTDRVRPPRIIARRTSGTALLPQLSREDRQSLLMLLAPFLIVAASLAAQQVLRTLPPLLPEIAQPRLPGVPAPVAIATPLIAVAPVAAVAPMMPANPPATLPVDVPALRTTTALRWAEAPPPRLSARERAARYAALKPTVRLEPITSEMLRPVPPPVFASRPEPEPADYATAAPLPPLASLAPVPPVPAIVAPVSAVPALALTPPQALPAPAVCEASPAVLGQRPKAHLSAMAQTTGQFGQALAAAAYEQLGDLVIYNARYARISYPMGDVASLYGVCTDVVVRAYRALGIDLQELIFTTKSGRGDIHIDHRRVDVVRRFLEKHGETLPISDFAEDFKPGDIVTYYRPQNRTSTAHIAVVSDRVAPSGRLMIIHNRGWGPQLEDALFVDKITGHYRFSGLTAAKPRAAVTARFGGAETARSQAQPDRTPWFIAGISRSLRNDSQLAAQLPPAQHAAQRRICLPQGGGPTLASGQTRPLAPVIAKPKAQPTRTASAAISSR